MKIFVLKCEKVPEENGDEPNNQASIEEVYYYYCDEFTTLFVNKKGKIRMLSLNEQKRRRMHVLIVIYCNKYFLFLLMFSLFYMYKSRDTIKNFTVKFFFNFQKTDTRI